MKLVESVTRAEARLTGIIGGDRRKQRVYLIDDGKCLSLAVPQGEYFGVLLENLADHMVGWPTFRGNNGKRLGNIYVANPEMNPNALSSDGGFLETGERYSRYQATMIDGLKLPGNQQRKFVAVGGDSFGGGGATELLIYRRTRKGVTVDQVLGGSRSVSSGPRIGAATTTPDGRQLTGLDYAKDAADPIFRIKIIYPAQGAEMLMRAGIDVPSNWSYANY